MLNTVLTEALMAEAAYYVLLPALHCPVLLFGDEFGTWYIQPPGWLHLFLNRCW